MRLLKCAKCGAMIEELKACTCDDCGIKCCGETMVEVKANSTDAAGEKHVPFCEIQGDNLYVRVGEIEHPMTEEHYITWIAAEYEDSVVKYFYKPGDKPEAFFDYEEGMVVYAYCNLHGLWKKEM